MLASKLYYSLFIWIAALSHLAAADAICGIAGPQCQKCSPNNDPNSMLATTCTKGMLLTLLSFIETGYCFHYRLASGAEGYNCREAQSCV